jgi:hypothetical protein
LEENLKSITEEEFNFDDFKSVGLHEQYAVAISQHFLFGPQPEIQNIILLLTGFSLQRGEFDPV